MLFSLLVFSSPAYFFLFILSSFALRFSSTVLRFLLIRFFRHNSIVCFFAGQRVIRDHILIMLTGQLLFWPIFRKTVILKLFVKQSK